MDKKISKSKEGIFIEVEELDDDAILMLSCCGCADECDVT